MVDYQRHTRLFEERPVPPMFDGFGERLPDCDAPAEARDGGSRWMLRLGTGLFWSLVVAVTVARVMFFDPHLAATFGSVAAAASQAIAVFGS